MSHRFLVSAGVLAVAVASASLISVSAQAPAGKYTPPKSNYVPPKTPWGDPDIQGIYDYQDAIPMQRPVDVAAAGKTHYTDAELKEVLKVRMPNQDACGFGTRKNEKCSDQQLKQVGAYNEFWDNRNLVADNRTSLIVDPPNGRFPDLTPEARANQQRIAGNVRQGPEGPERETYASWDEFPTVTRCIAEQTPNGVQMYNSGTYVMQTPGWVLIVRERLDTRIIPLDNRPHIGSNIRPWQGDSRGRWEGNTLVVDTTNFTDKQNRGGVGSTIPGGLPQGNVHLTEYFVPVSNKRIEYYATLEDPKTWAKPWTFMLPWEKDNSYTIYEYACQEGNISVGNALRGERMQGR